MLSPSQGFCCCLPVRVGALVVSLLSLLGSGILAGVTLRSLSIISAHITSIQTAGFYLTSLSWATLSFFSLLGFMSVIIQHPLMLTIFSRFVFYHIPASLLCNIFFTIVLFCSYRGTDAVLRSPECTLLNTTAPICNAFASLGRITWVYLFLILPTCIFQSYVYVMIKRFIFVVSGEWALRQEEFIERQRRSMGVANRKRRTTITQTIGNGGRRRAKALWFTMETADNATDTNESFLPSMIISPMDFTSPPRTPFSMASTAGLLSPFKSPRFGNKTSKSSLPSLPSSPPGSKKDALSSRSVHMGMDFSDPDPVTRSPPHSGEWMKPALSPWEESGEGEESQSDTHTRSRQGSSSSTKI